HLATHAARAGRPFKLRVRLNGLDAVCRMVERGVGVAIVPEAAAQRAAETLAIRAIPIDEPWTVRQLRLCARSFAALPPHARQLAEHLVEHLGASESPGFERTSPFAGPGQSPG
ncbi:LysR substrate-binding domain-containing protein, partial [Methylorubrum extorquens]